MVSPPSKTRTLAHCSTFFSSKCCRIVFGGASNRVASETMIFVSIDWERANESRDGGSKMYVGSDGQHVTGELAV